MLPAHQLADGHGPLRLLLEDVRRVATTLDGLSDRDAMTVLRVLSDRIRTELAAAGLSAGVGVATLVRTGTIAETVAAADAAMYVDKRRRRA